MSKTIVTYDDHKYQKLEIEETVAGSGRYTIQSRTSLTVYGVLDDEAVRNETKALVTNYVAALGTESMIMLLSDQDGKFYGVFSTLFALHAVNYESCFEAILSVIDKIGIVISKPYKIDNKIYFEMETYDGTTLTLILQGYTSKTIVVEG